MHPFHHRAELRGHQPGRLRAGDAQRMLHLFGGQTQDTSGSGRRDEHTRCALGMKAAQESYDAVAERYNVGASSIVDLLTAQTALVQAQAAQAQAHVSFTLQERTIDLALGTLVPQ